MKTFVQRDEDFKSMVAKFGGLTVRLHTDVSYTHAWLARLPEGFRWGFSTAKCRAFVDALNECGATDPTVVKLEVV